MTQVIDIANRALQFFGSRTNMTLAELTGQTSNEAIQLNLIMFQERDSLNRMAPWDCVTRYAPLTFITGVPGVPENASQAPPLWAPGFPPPPWAYEYQYPVDCIRACTIMPQYTSPSGNVPVFPPGTVTGANNIGWSGPALKFKVATDVFYTINAATPLGTGTGYVVGEIITLQQPSYTFVQQFPPFPQPSQSQSFTMPVGAPAQLLVTGVDPTVGFVTACSVITQVAGSLVPNGGSYYSQQPNPQGQLVSTGQGTGETFNLVWNGPSNQRVVLCNVEDAIIRYNTQIVDPNVMDPLFQDAWVAIVAARVVYQLSGDKSLANQAVGAANAIIAEARSVDGNEGLTVNDVTPDWLRVRGNWGGPNWEYTSNQSFDWGSFYSPY